MSHFCQDFFSVRIHLTLGNCAATEILWVFGLQESLAPSLRCFSTDHNSPERLPSLSLTHTNTQVCVSLILCIELSRCPPFIYEFIPPPPLFVPILPFHTHIHAVDTRTHLVTRSSYSWYSELCTPHSQALWQICIRRSGDLTGRKEEKGLHCFFTDFSAVCRITRRRGVCALWFSAENRVQKSEHKVRFNRQTHTRTDGDRLVLMLTKHWCCFPVT